MTDREISHEQAVEHRRRAEAFIDEIIAINDRHGFGTVPGSREVAIRAVEAQLARLWVARPDWVKDYGRD